MGPLALWAVRVNADYKGYRPLFGDSIRFVLLRGSERRPGTVVTWLLIHMLVLGPAAATLLVLAWRAGERED